MTTTVFKKGLCLECDAPVLSGQILCAKHNSITPIGEEDPGVMRISDMKDGDAGYTEEYAIFELNGKLWILATAQVIPEEEGYKRMYVKKNKDVFEIDKTTLDTDDIEVGTPNVAEETELFHAKLV